MPTMEEVGSAVLIMLAMVVVGVSIVALFMWLLYKFFKNKDDEIR